MGFDHERNRLAKDKDFRVLVFKILSLLEEHNSFDFGEALAVAIKLKNAIGSNPGVE